MMQTNLSYLSQRQDVLSQNIANANVPGYKAKDLKVPDFDAMLSESSGSSSTMALATTEPGHISGSSSFGQFIAVNNPTKTGETTPSGNNVVLENEVLKMSKTGLEYQQTEALYKKMMGLITTAIGSTS